MVVMLSKSSKTLLFVLHLQLDFEIFKSLHVVRVDPKYGLVDIKYKSRLRGDDYYVLAS